MNRRQTPIGAFALVTTLIAATVMWTVGPATPVAASPPNADGHWVVDSIGDGADSNAGDGNCADAGGACTLRAALQEAQAELGTAATGATVVFDPSVFGATITVGSTLLVTTPVGKTLDIIGPTALADRPQISGQTVALPLGIYGTNGTNGDGSDVNISGIVIRDGQNFGESGGGLVTNIAPGALTLERVSLLDNASTYGTGGLAATNDVVIRDSEFERNTPGSIDAYGGAISVSGGDLVVERTTISGSIAGGGTSFGGAIAVIDPTATITVVDSLITGNTAVQGGAIWCECGGLTLDRVSIVDNTANDSYGGLYVDTAGDVTFANTTVAQNQVLGDVSGGAYILADGAMTVTNSTFTANTAPGVGPGNVTLAGAGTLALNNTIIDGNLGPDFECNVQSPVLGGLNLLDGSCATGTPTGPGTISSVDSLLEPLTALGGRLTGVGDPLQVAAPGPGSPATGTGTCVTPVDGRGLPRPSTACDVGAVELDPAIADGRVFTVNDGGDAVDAMVGDGVCETAPANGTCTLRAAVLEADASANAASIVFDPSVTSVVLDIETLGCTTTVDNAFCGDLDVDRANLTVSGPDTPGAPATAAHALTLSPPIEDRLFHVDAPTFLLEDVAMAAGRLGNVLAGATNNQLTVRDAVISGPVVGGSFSVEPSIRAAANGTGQLTVDEVRIDNFENRTSGAISTSRDTTISRSFLTQHDGFAFISNAGSLEISDTVVRDNTSGLLGGGPFIVCESACTSLAITDSAIVGNFMTGAGELVHTTATGAPTVVANTTIADNAGVLGAIATDASPLHLRFSSVLFNEAGGLIGTHTGGLRISGAAAAVIENSMVYGNIGDPGPNGELAPDCAGGTDVLLIGENVFPPSSADQCLYTGDPAFTGTAYDENSPFSYSATPGSDTAWAETIGYPSISSSVQDVISPDRCTGDLNPNVRGGVFTDQRGMARPAGNGCEPGSFESAGVALADVTGQTDVVAGTDAVAAGDLALVSTGSTAKDGGADLAGASSTELRAIDLDATPLRQVPLRQVPLGALATDSDVLDAITLSELPLESATWSSWPDYLTDQATAGNGLAALAGLPLNTVSLGQVVRALSGSADEFGLPGLSLTDIDFSATPLGSLPIGALALGAATLLDIDSRGVDGTDWCGIIGRYTDRPCGPGLDVDPATASLVTINLLGVPLRQVPLRQVPLRQVDLNASPLRQVPLRQVEINATPLRQVPLRQVLLQDSPLRQVPLRQVDLLGSPLRQVPLRQVLLAETPLRQVPLRQVPLRQVDLTVSPLRQVPLRQVLLQDSPLRQVPLRQVDLLGSPLRQVPLRQVLLADTPLRQVPLRQVDLKQSPLRQVPLRQVTNPGTIVDCGAVDCASQTLTLGDVFDSFLTTATLGALIDALDPSTEIGAALDLAGAVFLAAFGDLTLGDLIDAVAADVDLGLLGDIGGPDFPDAYGDETQGAALTLEYLLSVLAPDVDFGDLGDIDAVAYPDGVGDLTLGELFDLLTSDPAFDETTVGELGGPGYPDAYGDGTTDILLGAILDLLQSWFGDDATLGDLLAGILPASEYPWEQIDLDDPSVLSGASTPTAFYTPVAVIVPESTVVEADITFPAGWRYAPGSITLGDFNRTVPLITEPTSVDVGSPDPATGATIVSATFEVNRPAPDRLSFDASPPIALVDTPGIAVELDAPEWNLVATPVESSPTTVRDRFEPENNAVGGAVDLGFDPGGQVVFSHIGTATDVDWFEVTVAQGSKLSAYLGNLPDDYDLLLYGDAPSALRGSADSALTPSPDGGLSLIGEDNATNAQIADDIDTTPPTGMVLYGSSTRRGAGDERIDTDALPAGTYYLRVSGFGSASGAKPYSLRVRAIASTFSGACDYSPGTLPAPPALDAAVTTLTPSTNTLVLTNLSRMARGYDDADVAVDAIENFVTTVNGDPVRFGGVNAAVVTLDDLPAYTAWDANPCDPTAANAVVSNIGARIDGVLANHPFIDNIVLVGADDQIPFGRVADAVPAHNESEYATTFDGTNPLSAALSLGYVLTDNPYGAANPISVGPRELFVPELAVGRLVESPSDIAAAFDNFIDFDGALDATTALSTGYDFLSDGAAAVSDELTIPRGIVPEGGLTELINDDWTRQDLADALDAGPDLASVNAHFDHYRALPADQDTAGVLDDPFVLDDITGDTLGGSVIFSMGCHAGLSVDDISVGGTLDDDWAQTFAAEGAVFAGNTGYGYGDDTVVGATEELMRQFAARLDGSMTVGQAMSFAKQRYTANLIVVSPFDEKVVNQVVFYGLPMFRLGAGEPPAPVVNPDTVTDPATGLEVFDTTASAEAIPVETDSGIYYETEEGGYQATPYQPVQPRATFDVTQETDEGERIEARGALILDLSSTDTQVDPVYVTPTDDATTPTLEADIDGAVFPSVLQSVSSYTDPSGERDQLVIVPGQFTGDPASTNGSGTQRIFESIDARVFYAPDGNTDVEPATIVSSQATIVGGNAVFEVVATDTGGSIEQVLVLFTDAANPGAWTPVTLVPSGEPDTFVGGAPAGGAERVDSFVQVVDSGGNVAVSTNKGVYYEGAAYVAPPPPPTAPTITLPNPGEDGAYAGTVAADITPGPGGGPVSVRVDGAAPVTSSSVEVSGSGLHTITATGPDGATSEVEFVISTPVTPTLSFSTTPAPAPSGWYTSAPTSTITGTGIASITTQVDDGLEVTSPSDSVDVGPLGDAAVHTIRYSGSTAVGTTIPTQIRTLRVDTTPPEITCPANPVYLLGQPDATLTALVADATSGVTVSTLTAEITTDAAGEFRVPFTATDVAGNLAEVECPAFVTYDVEGFDDPVDNDSVNVIKAGRAVPFKWRLTDYFGNPIADPASYVGIRMVVGDCGSGAGASEIQTVAATSGLKYNGDGEWQYNWKTDRRAEGCIGVTIDLLGAPGALTANFQLK